MLFEEAMGCMRQGSTVRLGGKNTNNLFQYSIKYGRFVKTLMVVHPGINMDWINNKSLGFSDDEVLSEDWEVVA